VGLKNQFTPQPKIKTVEKPRFEKIISYVIANIHQAFYKMLINYIQCFEIAHIACHTWILN
jgi:hypothetical protein